MSSTTSEPPIPIAEGRKPTPEEQRLLALFDELRKGQLTFLDEACKRIIELSTALLGVLFGVTAFGDKFPPAYLHSSPGVQAGVLLTLLLLVLALFSGVRGVQPRSYPDYEANLSEMRRTLQAMLAYKRRWMRTATWLFFAAVFLLAGLVAALVGAA